MEIHWNGGEIERTAADNNFCLLEWVAWHSKICPPKLRPMDPQGQINISVESVLKTPPNTRGDSMFPASSAWRCG